MGPARRMNATRNQRDHVMRTLLVLPLAAAVALGAGAGLGALDPPDAAAKPPPPRAGEWTGVKIANGLDLKFQVRGGRVTGFASNVYESCAGASRTSLTILAPDGGFPIRNGRFGGKRTERLGAVTLRYTIAGRITRARASGTMRMESVVAGARCDTFTLRWTARAGR